MGAVRAVFLDRDGTINAEKEYLYRLEEFEFIPGAPEAVRKLNDAGFAVIVVTNQSGVGRGYFDDEAVRTLHRYLDRLLEPYGAVIDAYYFCPHHPEAAKDFYRQACNCRKPLPGMLLEAAREYSVDLSGSYIVGDKLADIEAGLNAGCRPVLVRTGYGAGVERLLPPGVPCYDDLNAAVEAILADVGS